MATVAQITTADQLLAANLPHCELIAGEIIRMSPAGFDHGAVALRIAKALGKFLECRDLGIAVTAEAGFWIGHDPDTVRVPDLAFVSADRMPRERVKGFFEGAPDLAVEVVSPNDRASEVTAKAHEWLLAGCLLVWVVDPETRTISVYRTCGEVVVLSDGGTLTGGEVLPGFAVPVKEVFA